MPKAKLSYYDGIIQENSADQGSMWRAFNKILHQTQPKCIPECPSIERLGTMFGSFFVDKITQIRESFPDVPPSAIIPSPQISDETTFTSFLPASEEEIRRLILTSSKSCELDPISYTFAKSLC